MWKLRLNETQSLIQGHRESSKCRLQTPAGSDSSSPRKPRIAGASAEGRIRVTHGKMGVGKREWVRLHINSRPVFIPTLDSTRPLLHLAHSEGSECQPSPMSNSLLPARPWELKYLLRDSLLWGVRALVPEKPCKMCVCVCFGKGDLQREVGATFYAGEFVGEKCEAGFTNLLAWPGVQVRGSHSSSGRILTSLVSIPSTCNSLPPDTC